MARARIIAFLAATLLLAACQSGNSGGVQTAGTPGEAAAGGFAGSQTGRSGGNAPAPLTGVMIVNQHVGDALDDDDRRSAAAAEQRAYTAPVGQQVTWNNPQTGASGTIVAVRDGYAGNGAYCREFQQTVAVDGQRRQAYGKACQQPDGSWKIVQ